MPILPKHLLEGTDKDKLKDSPLCTEPIGTGPYMYTKWNKGDRIILIANPASYFRGKVKLERYIFLVKSMATIFLDLKAG